MLLADFIAENQFLQILLFEFTIVASEGYMRAFQMSNIKNKNYSELLLTNGMGLDGAPNKFLTFKISPLKVRPPIVVATCPICRVLEFAFLAQDLTIPECFAMNK